MGLETGTRKIQYRMAGCGGPRGACSGPRGRCSGPPGGARGPTGGPRWDAGGHGGPRWTEELFCVYFASSAPVPFPVGAVCLSLLFREQTLNWYKPSVPTPTQVPPPHGAGISNAHHTTCPDLPLEPCSPSKEQPPKGHTQPMIGLKRATPRPACPRNLPHITPPF